MSLAQIGEFSFIIAGLGLSLGATGDFLYPIAVAVSGITTLLTPWLIRSASRVGLVRRSRAAAADADIRLALWQLGRRRFVQRPEQRSALSKAIAGSSRRSFSMRAAGRVDDRRFCRCGRRRGSRRQGLRLERRGGASLGDRRCRCLVDPIRGGDCAGEPPARARTGRGGTASARAEGRRSGSGATPRADSDVRACHRAPGGRASLAVTQPFLPGFSAPAILLAFLVALGVFFGRAPPTSRVTSAPGRR